MRIIDRKGDIARLEVDAIVNSMLIITQEKK